ncbi:heavy-metal-associated domain-containing protein [Streptomyces sp. NPDC021093]|uniref:heavy-metal-associated domain-containing protein n=1 Tax=Streptomyces sp. NPDC021093 TaxID=3365112 RepID=UPI00378B45CE
MTAETQTPAAGEAAQTSGSCCSPSGSCGSTGAADVQVGGVTTVYQVQGMTCGHCEGAVSGEISEIAGVESVKAVASTGQVTVVSAAPLDEEAVRAAVDEAGYELVGTV